VANAVWDAFFGRDVTAGYYRSVADISPATATHDLAGAVAAGQRRARRYLAGRLLFGLVGERLGLSVPEAGERARSTIVAVLGQRLSGTVD
jgi:hypothetical protein